MSRGRGEILVGDVWRRRCELHDDFDLVRVTAMVDHGGFRPDEWIIRSATADFGPVLQTTAAGIIDFCTLVTSGEPGDEDWVG